jgi:hypothetical protein
VGRGVDVEVSVVAMTRQGGVSPLAVQLLRSEHEGVIHAHALGLVRGECKRVGEVPFRHVARRGSIMRPSQVRSVTACRSMSTRSTVARLPFVSPSWRSLRCAHHPIAGRESGARQHELFLSRRTAVRIAPRARFLSRRTAVRIAPRARSLSSATSTRRRAIITLVSLTLAGSAQQQRQARDHRARVKDQGGRP